MPVCGHGRHDAPGFTVWVVTLHSVEGLESVSASDHVETPVQHGHAKLKSPPAHGGYLPPGVPAQTVLLNTGGTWKTNNNNNNK